MYHNETAMKKYYIVSTIAVIIAAAIVALNACTSQPKIKSSMPYKIHDGRIELKTPARPAGQQSALGMTADPIDTVRIGLVGLGMRGDEAVRRLCYIDEVKITAICDLLPDRVKDAQDYLAERGREPAAEYSGEEGYKQLCESPDIDLVYICTPWQLHTTVSLYAMEHGKHVACEVPAMLSIEDCWKIINTSERTRKHFMMMENCCYDFYELVSLNMAQQGVFGEILHAEGAYIHNLDPYWTRYQGNWRLDFNQSHRGDVYPTHGIGPVCQALNIHRGDRLEYVVSQDTKSVHGKEVAKEVMNTDEYANGDHTVSLIRTVNGKQIEIQHNVYGARPYSRMHMLSGTEGTAVKYPWSIFCVDSKNLPDKEIYKGLDPESPVDDDVYDELMKDYTFPFVEEISQKALEVGGHGGMDFIMDWRLIYCLRHGLPLDQDVYDAAEWSCLVELSRISLEAGSMPVAVPDFTRGDWNKTDGFSFAF